jgi:hypothetical protein
MIRSVIINLTAKLKDVRKAISYPDALWTGLMWLRTGTSGRTL